MFSCLGQDHQLARDKQGFRSRRDREKRNPDSSQSIVRTQQATPRVTAFITGIAKDRSPWEVARRFLACSALCRPGVSGGSFGTMRGDRVMHMHAAELKWQMERAARSNMWADACMPPASICADGGSLEFATGLTQDQSKRCTGPQMVTAV